MGPFLRSTLTVLPSMETSQIKQSIVSLAERSNALRRYL